MKAVIKTKPEKGNVELKEAEIPGIGPGEVLIQSKAAPGKYLHRIPQNVSFEDGAMAEDLGVVITVMTDSQAIGIGDTVVVMGPGPIGLLSLQVARICGAGHIVVTGTNTDMERLELAGQLGADRILNVEKEDLEQYVREYSDGDGVDSVILANSSASAIHQAFSILKKYGTMVALGYPPGPAEIPFYEITAKALTVVGGWGASSWKAWERALQCISSGAVKVSPLVTHKFSLENWKEAFDTFSSCKGLKVQLIP